MQVTADHVNLRSCAGGDCEVVAQVSTADILETRGRREGDWIEVSPPKGVAVWVYAELIASNTVAVESLMVRGGPGINYRPVDTLHQGDAVTVIGKDGEWLRIAAPATASLWINALYVRDVVVAAQSQVAVPEGAMPPVRVGIATPAVEPASTLPSTVRVPSDSMAGPVEALATSPPSKLPVPVGKPESRAVEQPGKVVHYDGVVRPAGMAVWRRPSRFRLVQADSLGRHVTRCYLVGDEKALSRLEGRRVSVSGRERWVKGVRYPVVAVDALQQAP